MLGHEHLDELAPPVHEGGEVQRRRVIQGPGRRARHFAKPGQYPRINRVRLREALQPFREIPDLSGIDHRDAHPRQRERRHHGGLIAAGRLDDDTRRAERDQRGDEGTHPRVVISDPPSPVLRQRRDVEMVL